MAVATGSNVVSLTSSPIRGRQNRTVAYQGPSNVVPDRRHPRLTDPPDAAVSWWHARSAPVHPSPPATAAGQAPATDKGDVAGHCGNVTLHRGSRGTVGLCRVDEFGTGRVSGGQCKRLVEQASDGRIQGGALTVDLRRRLLDRGRQLLDRVDLHEVVECFRDLLLGRGDLVDALAACRRDGGRSQKHDHGAGGRSCRCRGSKASTSRCAPITRRVCPPFWSMVRTRPSGATALRLRSASAK